MAPVSAGIADTERTTPRLFRNVRRLYVLLSENPPVDEAQEMQTYSVQCHRQDDPENRIVRAFTFQASNRQEMIAAALAGMSRVPAGLTGEIVDEHGKLQGVMVRVENKIVHTLIQPGIWDEVTVEDATPPDRPARIAVSAPYRSLQAADGTLLCLGVRRDAAGEQPDPDLPGVWIPQWFAVTGGDAEPISVTEAVRAAPRQAASVVQWSREMTDTAAMQNVPPELGQVAAAIPGKCDAMRSQVEDAVKHLRQRLAGRAARTL
jgi:hypothetical protein